MRRENEKLRHLVYRGSISHTRSAAAKILGIDKRAEDRSCRQRFVPDRSSSRREVFRRHGGTAESRQRIVAICICAQVITNFDFDPTTALGSFW